MAHPTAAHLETSTIRKCRRPHNPIPLIFPVCYFVAATGQLNGQGKCIEARRGIAQQQIESVAEKGVEVIQLAGALNDMGALCHDDAHYRVRTEPQPIRHWLQPSLDAIVAAEPVRCSDWPSRG